MKKERGITLVSLVVTIIILIILAGISINLTLGENGIITIAKQAKENTELAKIEEETRLNELYSQISETNYGSISYDEIAKLVEFKKEIASAITDMGIATSEDADASTMASNIKSISGTSSADKVTYDNTNSGLTSTNVQGAIDEVNNSLNNILSEPIFKQEVLTLNRGGSAGSNYEWSTPLNVPDGYKWLSTEVSSSSPNVIAQNWVAGTSNSIVLIYYIGATSTTSFRCIHTYIKTDLIN